MYNPGVTISAPGIASVANCRIYVPDISIDGAKTVLFTVTTPWNTIAPDEWGVEGDIFRWASGNHVLMMKIMAVNEAARTATFRLLSFATPSDIAYFNTTHNLPVSAVPGGVLNYTFDVTNITSNPTSVRWIFGSQESGVGAWDSWIEHTQLESFPPTTIVRNKNCWYEDWAIGGACATGQTIMPGGFIRISGSLTVLAPIGKRENATLAVFVLVPNFWQTVAPGGPGGDEYVLSYFGGSITDVSILSDPCAGVTCADICGIPPDYNLYYQTCDPLTGNCIQGTLKQANSPQCNPCTGKVCTPDYICVGCDSYNAICNPADPTGLCIQGTLRTTNDPLCVYGTLRITSVPTGANVYVNDVLKGTTPLDITLVASTYTVKLTLLNYQDYVNNNATVACGGITPLSATMSPRPAEVYDLTIKLDLGTPSSYIVATLQRFTNLLDDWILSRVSNVRINSVTYDQAKHQINVEIEELQTLSGWTLSEQQSMLRILQQNYGQILQQNYGSSFDQPHIKSLPLPVLAVGFILWVAPFVAIFIGYLVASVLFGLRPIVPTYSILVVNVVQMVNELAAIPTKDVIVEFNGEKSTANPANNYTVIFANLEVEKIYPISAYIPLSAGSKVKEASIDCTISPCTISISSDPINYYTARIRVNNLQQRDYRQCNLALDNGNPVPVGTIVRVYNPIALANSDIIIDPLGSTTIGPDGCMVDIIKVPSSITDKHIKKQFVTNIFNPNDPSPTLIDGDVLIVPTYNGEKNTISVTVATTIGGYPIADKIDVIDKATNTIVKSVIPDKYISLITGIPRGTYNISVTMAGYRLSLCNPATCEVTFTTDYLGLAKMIVVLESIEKTCSLNIYARDKYGKAPKSLVYISLDDKPKVLSQEGNLLIPTIVAKSHKFSITADGYGTITENRTITCAEVTEIQIFKMDQTGEIPLPEALQIYVNNLQGSISIGRNTSFAIKITGANPGENVDIKNISTTPDTSLTSGLANASGIYETTLTVDNDVTFEIQAFQRCILLICSKTSNIIELKVGKGSPECAVPNPLGGCLIEKTTGYGLMLLAGLGLLAAIMIFRPGGAAQTIVERVPYPVPKLATKE